MNEKRGSKGPKWGLLLLIPAAVILVKGAMHHRARWESAWGASAAGRGYCHPGRFGAAEGAADGRGAFRLPPKIESMLDAWHTRTHEAAESTEPPTT